MKKTNFSEWDSLLQNDSVYALYFNRLLSIAIAMFEWKNLPPSIDEIEMERMLCERGSVIVFFDDVLSKPYFATYTGTNLLPWTRLPENRVALGFNGAQYSCTNENSVIIFNNVLRTPSIHEIQSASIRLADMQRTIDVNLTAQKTPYIVLAEEKQKTTMKNAFNQIRGNEPVIFGYQNLDLNKIKVLTTNAPFIADKVRLEKSALWTETLSSLGVPVITRNKRERLISGEVASEFSESAVQLSTRLTARKRACKELNAMFGWNVDVDYTSLGDLLTEPFKIESGDNEEKEVSNSE